MTENNDEQQEEQARVWVVDLSIAPTIYCTSNPEHYGKFCIDFQPETVPTIASFHTELAAYEHLKERFPEYHATWFPHLYDGQERATCLRCLRYTLVTKQVQRFCPDCLAFIHHLNANQPAVEVSPSPAAGHRTSRHRRAYSPRPRSSKGRW